MAEHLTKEERGQRHVNGYTLQGANIDQVSQASSRKCLLRVHWLHRRLCPAVCQQIRTAADGYPSNKKSAMDTAAALSSNGTDSTKGQITCEWSPPGTLQTRMSSLKLPVSQRMTAYEAPLKTPSWSMPASSRPWALMNFIRMTPFHSW